MTPVNLRAALGVRLLGFRTTKNSGWFPLENWEGRTVEVVAYLESRAFERLSTIIYVGQKNCLKMTVKLGF